MEEELMKEIKKLLNEKFDVEEIEIYYDLEGNCVVSYKYNNEKYVITNDLIEL